jgi:mono/diheme cytochrome c family protein
MLIMRFVANTIAAIFGFISGVLRNARTFHPDGRTFLGTVTAETSDQTLLCAAKLLEGQVLLRIGMGLVKRTSSGWAKKWIPDAPSVAARFSPSPHADAISRGDRGNDELDILLTAGGDRLWKLILNLATGGRHYGLHQFDYFNNLYFAEVPYRVRSCGLDAWLRLRALPGSGQADSNRPANAESREQALTDAIAQGGAEFVIEAQSATARDAPFIPFARIRIDREIEVDQESLHFQPVAGRGFEPYGILTTLRDKVYPASAHARPPTRDERVIRDRKGFFCRLIHGPTGKGFSLQRLGCAVILLLLVILLLSAGYAAWRFLPNHAIPVLPDQPNAKYSQLDRLDALRFKYGSTGGEANLGIPLPIWQVTPLVCAETLKGVLKERMAADYVKRVRNYSPRLDGKPDATTRLALSREGYEALGLTFDDSDGIDGKPVDIPIGVSKRRNLGFDRVFVNCAFCHASTVRVSADTKPQVVLGMPANNLDIRNFEDFLFTCTAGPQFGKENIIPEIENMHGPLGLLDKYLIYPLAIWIIRDRVQYLSSRLGFFTKQPDWGPGRVDTFSNAKGIFNWPWRDKPDWHEDHKVEKDQVGTVDFPSIWLQGARKTRSADGCPMELHWDGNNDSVEERNLSAAFGTGALPPIIDHHNLGNLEKWLLERSKPPQAVGLGFAPADPQKAEQGKAIYQERCAKCHGVNGSDFSGELVGQVTRIEDIKTDRYRLDNYTEELAATQSMLYAGEKKPAAARPSAEEREQMTKCGLADHGNADENTYRFKRFHKTNGYANLPLDGIWLRAPYLHNGSVPTLWDLLNPQAKRPGFYYRGSDVYDWENLGFKSESRTAPNGTTYFLYDTTEPGNSNEGHEGYAYGTDLSDDQKRALIEYLKEF